MWPTRAAGKTEESPMGRILIAEDNELMRSMLGSLCTSNGHEVELASDGLMAMELLKESSIDLMITDIAMPGKEGLELIREVKQDFPQIRIVAISGSPSLIGRPEMFLSVASSLGADRVFAKPLANAQLLEAVDELLG